VNDNGLEPTLKAGTAQFWYVAIHPFDDGNERVGRAVMADLPARVSGLIGIVSFANDIYKYCLFFPALISQEIPEESLIDERYDLLALSELLKFRK
jgi:hypothetical protein